MADFDKELDASGLNCPLPILRAKKSLNGMDAGQVLHIIATDPGSVKDFEAFARQTGNELMESKEEGRGWKVPLPDQESLNIISLESILNTIYRKRFVWKRKN